MKEITVLLTAASSMSAPEFVRCLKENGERTIRVVGVDCNMDETTKEYCDETYRVPSVSSYSYIDCLLTICEHENVDVLIPWITEEEPLLYANKNSFERIGVALSISNIDSINICANKYLLYEKMKENGMKMPLYKTFNTISGFKEAVSYIGYPQLPVCVKALSLRGSRGMRIIDNSKSRFEILFDEKPNSVYTTFDDMLSILEEQPDNIPNMMAMEYLSGEELSVDVLASDGEVKFMCARISNHVEASIPMENILFNEPKAYKIVEQVIKMLSYDGNADFDFKYNDDGEPVLMEVNPRMAATMAIFKEGGANLPYLRVKQLLGEEIPHITPKYGVTMKRRYKEYYS